MAKEQTRSEGDKQAAAEVAAGRIKHRPAEGKQACWKDSSVGAKFST